MKKTDKIKFASKDKKVSKELPPLDYRHSEELPAFFETHKISLIVTTYQANRVLTFTSLDGRMNMLMREFDMPMGITIRGAEMFLCCRQALWYLRNLGTYKNNEGDYDSNWIPRSSHLLGGIFPHEITVHNKQIVIVNTRFSCLCTISPAWSFVPIWKPRFITELRPEDRCHLNGVCNDENGPKYVTALAESNTAEGWREKRLNGGIIMDVGSGEIISRDLCMPHSPRIYADKLWVLNSGCGELQIVDPLTGKRDTVAELPGFLRGLCFFKNYAVIAASRPRQKSTFGNLPIEKRYGDFQSGVYFVDINTGKVEVKIRFMTIIEELFDVLVLEGAKNPHIFGPKDNYLTNLFQIPSSLGKLR